MAAFVRTVWKFLKWTTAGALAFAALLLVWGHFYLNQEASAEDGKGTAFLKKVCGQTSCVPFKADGAPIHIITAANGRTTPEQDKEESPEGVMNISVSTPDAIVVLFGFNRILWDVKVEDRVTVRRVVAIGFHDQRIKLFGKSKEDALVIRQDDLSRIAGIQSEPPTNYDSRNVRVDIQNLSLALTGMLPTSYQPAHGPRPQRIPLHSLGIDTRTAAYTLPTAIGPMDVKGRILLRSSSPNHIDGHFLLKGESGAYTEGYSDVAFSKGKVYVEGRLLVHGAESAHRFANFGLCMALDNFVDPAASQKTLAIQEDQKHSTFKDGDIFGVAVDFDLQRVYLRTNGVWLNGEPGGSGGVPLQKNKEYRICAFASGSESGEVQDGAARSTSTWEFNFGDKPFRNTAPDGYLPPSR